MKASFTTIAAVLVAAAIVFPAKADDYGPHGDIRAIRGSLPVILAYPLAQENDVMPAIVHDVVISGDDALAAWHAGAIRGVAAMHRRSGLWWLRRNANTLPGDPDRFSDVTILKAATGGCAWSSPAQSAMSAIAGSVPPDLAGLGAAHGILPAAAVPAHSTMNGDNASRSLDDICPAVSPPPAISTNVSTGGTAFLHAANEVSQLSIDGRAPTLAEMPPAPHMNSYYFFRLSSKGPAPVKVRGATLDIWFPYVLDANRGYSLWLDFLNPDVDDLGGTLKDNVLHFTLPDFETIPGKEAFGEIDGDA